MYSKICEKKKYDNKPNFSPYTEIKKNNNTTRDQKTSQNLKTNRKINRMLLGEKERKLKENLQFFMISLKLQDIEMFL